MTRKKRMLLFAVAVAVLGITAFTVMAVKDRTYVPSAAYSPVGESNREVAVVYYSRSGHSEAVAREVARTFNAPIARIDADYPLDFAGQGKAVSDARAEALPKITVEPIDLDPARRVFLVSPTWMFRPATPLWAYVEQADLRGKEVVLVTTGNSRFEQAEIDAFAGGWSTPKPAICDSQVRTAELGRQYAIANGGRSHSALLGVHRQLPATFRPLKSREPNGNSGRGAALGATSSTVCSTSASRRSSTESPNVSCGSLTDHWVCEIRFRPSGRGFLRVRR